MAQTATLRKRVALLTAMALGLGLLIVAPASAAGISVALSNAILNVGSDTSATSDARIIHPRAADKSAGSQAATVVVSLKDADGNAMTADILTVTSSGPGLLGTGLGSPSAFLPAGHSISVTVSSVVSGKYVFGVFGDGTGGFSTVSIHDGDTLLATKFAAFYGPVVSLTAFPNLLFCDVNGSPLGSNSPHNPGDGTYAHTPAVILTGKDANGVPVLDEDPTEFSAVSSDLSVLSPEISVIPDDTLGAGSLGAGTYNVQIHSATGAVSGKSATLTFRYSDAGTNFISTAPVTFTTSSSTIHHVVLSFNKEVYGPGDNAMLTIHAFDSSGNPVSGQDSGNFFATSTGLLTSAPISKLLFPFTTVTFIDGKATTSFDLPTTSGLFTVSGRLGNSDTLLPSLQGLPISTTVTVLTPQEVDIAATKVFAAAAFQAVMSLTALVKAMSLTIARIMKKLGLK